MHKYQKYQSVPKIPKFSPLQAVNTILVPFSRIQSHIAASMSSFMHVKGLELDNLTVYRRSFQDE